MEKQQTAVQTMIKDIEDLITIETYQKWKDIKRKCLEMEKEQIIEAHGDEQLHLQDDGSWRTVTAEQYYNETYGK